jgi:metal-dependent hydrolase (beta-lactamase superfamily II)
MKLKVLSHYDNDLNTRFGDCILLNDNTNLVVYDCGHSRHADEAISFLQSKSSISTVRIVVSHNDSDHTVGINELLTWLHIQKKYSVSVYTHQYLKHVDTILNKIDDGRRTRESLKKALLAEFDNIKTIIETAVEYGFTAVEALCDVTVGNCNIVGPTVDEFTDVAAKAVDNRVGNNIGEGHAEETVMNAASVQIKCKLDNAELVLLCGDASPDYLRHLDDYDIIQLPHHGQLADAEAVFDALSNAGSKVFLVSDNTGSGATSGGSDDLMKSDARKGKRIKNTKDGIVELPEASIYDGGGSKTRSGIVVPSNQKTGGHGA